jgi:hypothetical protein
MACAVLRSEFHGQRTLRYVLCVHVQVTAGFPTACAELDGLRVSPGASRATAIIPNDVISATKTNLFMTSLTLSSGRRGVATERAAIGYL